MSCSPTLLGLRRKTADNRLERDCEYKFLTHQEVTIVNDFDDYLLFSDCLFIAPREESIERACRH